MPQVVTRDPNSIQARNCEAITTGRVGYLVDKGKEFFSKYPGLVDKNPGLLAKDVDPKVLASLQIPVEQLAPLFAKAYQAWVLSARNDPEHPEATPEEKFTAGCRCIHLQGLIQATSSAITVAKKLSDWPLALTVDALLKQEHEFANSADCICSQRIHEANGDVSLATGVARVMAALPTMSELYKILAKRELPQQFKNRLDYAVRHLGLNADVRAEAIKNIQQHQGHKPGDNMPPEQSFAPLAMPSGPLLPGTNGHRESRAAAASVS